jgi:hypothetical protein
MKKIFVVGCPRSGTTLVQKLLGSRGDVYTCTETHYFQRIRRVGKWKVLDYLAVSQDNIASAFEFIQAHNELLGEYDPRRAGSLRSAVLFFDQIMTTEAESRGKLAWVEKTPPHLFYVGWISRYIPSAQFVHMLRDGRDVVASMVDAAHKFPETEVWKRYRNVQTAIDDYNRCMKESLKHCGREGHVFVQYEHILEDVVRVCHRLFGSLGLDDEMLDLDFDRVHGCVVRNDEGWKSDSGSEIKDTRLAKFDRMFDEEQKRLVVSSLKLPSPVLEEAII